MAQEQDFLAKKDYVDENYQPRLVAGTGISINPITNEITSTGGGSLVTYAGNPNISQGDSLGVLTINGTSNTIMSPGLIPGTNVTITTDITTGAKTIAATGGTTVTPNPQGTPSGVLTSIGIGNAIYSLQGGAYYGTTDPDSSLGIDGDIYIKYTSGTPDTIDAMFVKINDEWIEAELGGGGASDLNDLTDVDITSPTNGQVLKYNSTTSKWENGTGGGGTDVEANPTGSATDTLNKIKIGQTIYDIEGGSSSGYIEKELVYTVEQGARWETFTNPDSDNPLLIENVYKGAIKTFIFNPNNLPARDGGVDNYVTIGQTLTGININLGQVNSGETVYISLQTSFDPSIQSIKVYKILSYNNIEGAVELYSSNTVDNTITLSQSFRDFEYINLVGLHNEGYSVNSIYRTSTMSNDSKIALCDDAVYMWYTVTDDTTLTLYRNSSGYHVAKIYGFNIGGGGGGGTTVIANPEEEPTDALETIQIDDIVYNIPGGLEPIEIQWSAYRALPLADRLDPTKQYFVKNIPGGGDGTIIDDLFENDGTTNPTTITFDNPITDYDIISFQVETTNHDAIFTMDYIVDNLTIGDYIGAGSYSGLFVWYTYTDVDELTFLVQSAAGHYLSRIRGTKFGLGGGGTEVEANPSETPTDTLETIKIGETIYEIESGSGGSLEAEEMTTAEYNQLPSADKYDEKVIHFINDTTGGEVETSITMSDFYNRNEGSISISVVDGELVYTWNGGNQIGASSYYPTVIPATVTKIKYKITTGNSYSTTTQRFKIAIGVKATYNTSAWATAEDTDWLAVDIQNTQNTEYEGEVDLSEINTDSYLMIGAHGWTITFNEIKLVEEVEPTGATKIMYKDVAYGTGGGSSFVKLAEYTDSEAGYAAGSTITLSQDITNFDILLFSVVWQNGTDGFPSGSVVVDDFIDKYTARIYADYSGAGYVDVLYLNNTSISVLRTGGEFVHAVYGVKFGSGSSGDSEVEPNPQGEPTDTLNTIGINGTIYEIAGSGGGEGYETEIIYQNPGTTIPSTITLTKSINDFDMILLSGYRSDMTSYWSSSSYLSDEITSGRIIALTDDTYYAWYTVTNDTTLTSAATGIVIDKIYGLKFGSGGSSGINYSTNEQEIGTWIDGKPLYQKTIEIPSIPSNDSTTFSYGINDAITIRDYKCIIIYGSGSEQLYWDINIPRPDSNNSAIYSTATKTGFFIRTFTAWTASANLTIWYTKDND